MSFTKFVHERDKPNVIISLEDYSLKLKEKLQSIMEFSETRAKHIRESSIDVATLRRFLIRVDYPFIEEMTMAVATHLPRSIAEEHRKFSVWAKNSRFQEDVSKINSILYDYKRFLYEAKYDYDAEQIEKAFESSLEISKGVMTKIQRQVESAIDSIIDWHGSNIVLNGLVPETEGNWVVQEIDVIMGGEPVALCFRYRDDRPRPFIEEAVQLEAVPTTLLEDYDNLVNALKKQQEKPNIVTLYMRVDKAHRNKFDGVQKELALGIEAAVPSAWSLYEDLGDITDYTPERDDVWKIKIQENRIFPLQGDPWEGVDTEDVRPLYGFVSDEPTPIKWIERVQDEEKH